jgi:predicted extracellular nuclease
MRAGLLALPTKGRVAVALAGLALAAAALLGGASPGTAAPSSGIVVNEVYGGGGNSGATYTNDFIELRNRGAAAVSLDGWSVQYHSGSATGDWQVTALSGSLAPGAIYLVAEAKGTGGTQPLPTPQATGTIGMSNTSGTVAVVNGTAALT